MSNETHKIENAKCLEHRKRGGTITDIKFEAPCFTEPQWMPFSQVDEDSEVWHAGDEGTLIMSEWFAKKMEWVF